MSILNNFKNIRKNYQEVKSSPYKSLVMRLKMNKYLFWFVALVIVWRVVDLILTFTTITAAINKLFLIVISVWLIVTIKSNEKKILDHMKAYDGHPESQGYYDTSTNVKAEIDDLIKTLKAKEKK
ncbi:MAG: hypothetical protein EOL97_07090 [Spirochaetia bacterium]|nr:hypothetical protein [Spirochaetia bacterium]